MAGTGELHEVPLFKPATGSGPDLSVRLVGQIALSRDGVDVPLPSSRKTRALLGYLVATRAPAPRQRLCDLFFDGPDDPRAALRWSLTKLRPLVDGATEKRLVADREQIAFEARGARVDLFEAETRAGSNLSSRTTDDIERAADALGGDFLEGLDLPDCYRFHEWCTGERERVRALRVAVLDELVERLTATPERALKYARQRVAVDPLSDTAHAAVVRLLARLGRRAEAQAQVDTCRRIVDRELNGRRSPALDLACLEIGKISEAPPDPPRRTSASASASAPARAPASASAPALAPAPARSPALPLVARTRELAALAALVRDTAASCSHGALLLSGEPGIGKSRLLDELATQFRASGATVLAGRAFESESVRPYGIWTDLLRGVSLGGLAADLGSALAPLLPELGEVKNDPETKARLFDGVARLFRELSARGSVAILIDDLHWLDEASAGLLHYVARVSEGTRVAIACASREGELSDNPGALRLVRALRREGRLVDLPIVAFDQAATAELVRATFVDVDAARVFQESGGNPLFAIEVARSFARSSDDDDLGDLGPAQGPRLLEALLDERLERLDGRARDLVVWAAALGRQFDPELLVRVTGEGLAQTIAAIGDLEHHGLLSSSGTNAYSFAHELLRKAAYRRLSGPRRRLIHLAIARALAAAPDPGAAWGDVVHHATLAEDPQLTARACVAAAERCLRLHARAQAYDFAARGLAQLSHVEPAQGLGLRLSILRVAGYLAGTDAAKDAAFEGDAHQAVLLARELGRADEEAMLLNTLSFFRHGRGDDEGARANTVGAAEVARTADPVANVATLAHSAFCLVLIERELPKARALLDEAIEIARSRRLSIADVELGSGTLLQFEGENAAACVALGRALVLARANGDSWRESIALLRLAMVAIEHGEWAEARARAAAMAAVATKFGDGTEGIAADAVDALAVHGSGAADGLARVETAARALSNADAKSMLAFLLTSAAETELRAGTPERARELATRGLQAAEPLGRPSAIVLAHAVLGAVELAGGHGEVASAHFAAATALMGDPYSVTKRAREALRSASAGSNAGANAQPVGTKLRTRRR